MARSAQLERFKRRLDAIPSAVKNAVKPSLEKSGNELVAQMKRAVPIDTGALRDSLTMTPSGQATPAYSQPGGTHVVPENAVVVTAGNSDVRYAHLVEYGTTKANAEPYFWPSLRALKDKIKRRTANAIRDAVRKDWGR
jgi:HK97 gp10 family phage protein